MLDTVACGAAFGAALAVAAVHQPQVIVSQLSLTNFHMLESFLAAAASSALFTAVVQATGYATFPPRSFSSTGLLGTSLDGNLLGGLLQGAGMALSGACTGTVFAQNGSGIRSSFHALGGAMVGGIVWTGFLRPALQRRRKPQNTTTQKLTVDRRLGLGRTTTLLLLETVFVAAIGVAASSSSSTMMSRTQGPVHPVTGGLLIGLAQLFSILLRKTMLGTSTAFEEFGDSFWWLAGGARTTRPSHKNMLFAASLALGSYLVSLRFPTLITNGGMDSESSPARVALGGALIAIGSRMAGGCTSGHGISGISLMSVSSFVTVAAMFAGGIGVTSALG
ncbi:YeeE/YedE family protein [Apiospora marii]|uniref:YeeE/YedE family protein n=1 Tax=Apiospora marii TaxID=335849 RepID=UPI0031300DC2